MDSSAPPFAQFSYRKPGRVAIIVSTICRKFVTPAKLSGRGFSGAVSAEAGTRKHFQPTRDPHERAARSLQVSVRHMSM